MDWVLQEVFADGVTRLGKRVTRRFRGENGRIEQRLHDLITAHRLSPGQILSLAESQSWVWSIGLWNDFTKLREQLTTEQLSWLADTFHVERAWLEGRESRASMPFWGYKDLPTLTSSLDKAGWIAPDLRMTILAVDYPGNDAPLGRFHIVFSSPICEDDESISKHALFEASWDWSHPPCRMDAKAIARWFSMVHGHYRRVPIVSIRWKEFRSLSNGESMPARFVPSNEVGFDCLENRVLFDHESTRAIELYETEAVITHLNSYGLMGSISQLT